MTDYEGPAEKPEDQDIRAIAQVALYLEHEVGVDLRRIHIKVSEGIIHLQGSVSSKEQKDEIETELPNRPSVLGLISHLSVREERSEDI